MKATTAARLAAAVAMLGIALGTAEAVAAAPGDNGDVKIHNAGTSVDDQRNESHVCVFYLDAFGFDGVQRVDWHIDQQPPTGTARVSQGSITLDQNGHGYTPDMTLPDGHYKLYWTWEGQHGSAKSKVFWVDCASPSPSASPSMSASGSPSASASPSSSTQPSVSASPSASATPSSSAAPPVHPSPSSTAGGGPTLPTTGTPLAFLLALAGTLVAAGLLLRTRPSRLWHRD
jgi:hypothetical protein